MTYRQPFVGDYGISQRFGEKYTDPTGHKGIDYLCPMGTPILATAEGVVMFAGSDKTGYGNMVAIRHPDVNMSVYAHLNRISVQFGQSVKQGDVIGYSGTTGNSTGPHLHFEMRGSGGKPFDPATILTTVDDSIGKLAKLKGAADLQQAVKVTAPAGAKAWNDDFTKYNVLLCGDELEFTGNTKQRNGLTFCEVHPKQKTYWVAVHDGDTQILDNREG